MRSPYRQSHTWGRLSFLLGVGLCLMGLSACYDPSTGGGQFSGAATSTAAASIFSAASHFGTGPNAAAQIAYFHKFEAMPFSELYDFLLPLSTDKRMEIDGVVYENMRAKLIKNRPGFLELGRHFANLGSFWAKLQATSVASEADIAAGLELINSGGAPRAAAPSSGPPALALAVRPKTPYNPDCPGLTDDWRASAGATYNEIKGAASVQLEGAEVADPNGVPIPRTQGIVGSDVGGGYAHWDSAWNYFTSQPNFQNYVNECWEVVPPDNGGGGLTCKVPGRGAGGSGGASSSGSAGFDYLGSCMSP